MRLCCDRIGFPVAEIEELALAVLLLPVTKLQFERSLGNHGSFDDDWYTRILDVSPRTSWRQFDPNRPQGLFFTGVLPNETTTFAHWMGEGFRLPTVNEWREIDRWSMAVPLDKKALTDLHMHQAAEAVVTKLSDRPRVRSLGDISLLRGGVAEWVTDRRGFTLLGKPEGTCWNPQNETIPAIQPDIRDVRFGFRLVRSLNHVMRRFNVHVACCKI